MVIIQNASIYLSDTAVFRTITEIITISEEEHSTNLTLNLTNFI